MLRREDGEHGREGLALCVGQPERVIDSRGDFFCQARKDVGLPVLSPDDVAWISALYPNAQTANGYGLISGVIYFSDGRSLTGANPTVQPTRGSAVTKAALDF